MVGESEKIQGGIMKEVPYIVHESEMARLERVIKRMFILLIILIVLLFGTNAGWLWYESQFEDVVTEVEQTVKTDDNSKAVVNDGVHINERNDTPESDNNEKSSEK